MKKSNTFGSFAEIVHYVKILRSNQSEARTLSKNGQGTEARKLRDKIDATNQIIFARLQPLLARDNFPVCGEYEDGRYYVAKDGDSIVFSETASEYGTYYYR
ncbi:MAG TPA: hypothetical protein PLZ51_23790, partial [Aggregatilineales bacterium]|nr:hypothetical protein [Aggregatilineales bacterium]